MHLEPTLPVIGSVVQIGLANKTFPHLAFQKLAKKYGDIMSLGFGAHFMVVFSSFEIIKDAMTRSEASGRYVFSFVTDRAFGKERMGIIWNSGDSWQELKRHAIRNLRDFGFGKRSMEVVMLEEIADLMSIIMKNRDPETSVWKVDPWLLGAGSINMLWSSVAGERFPTKEKDGKLYQMVRLNENILVAMGYTNRYMAFPFVRKLFPKWSQAEKHIECYIAMQNFLREIISEIKENRQRRVNKEPESFIEAFLEEIEKRKGDKNEMSFTEEQLIVLLKDLFLAGSETTALSLNWTIMYLSVYPEVQRRVYEEIKAVVGIGPENHISLTHEPRMLYLKATILEVFRTVNFLPVPGPRMATEEFSAGGFTIPKGAGLMFNLEPVFKDKAFWGDPENFRPERFLETNADGEMKIINAERISVFGFGRRICLGESLARNSTFLFVTTLVKNFEIATVPGNEPSLIPQCGPTLFPYPYSVKLKERA